MTGAKYNSYCLFTLTNQRKRSIKLTLTSTCLLAFISSIYCPSKEKNTLVLTVAQLTAQMEDERRFYQMQIESLKEERRLILQDFDVKYQQFQDEVNTVERHKQDLHKAFTQLTTGN
jgi:hypothetical protein